MNTLEIRQEEIKGIEAQDIENACAQLMKIFGSESAYTITYNHEHAAPTIENAYIGDFEIKNRFNEEIAGKAIFFPNTDFIHKDSRDVQVDIIQLYVIKSFNGYHIVADKKVKYGSIKKEFHNITADRLDDSLFYSAEENKVRQAYVRKIKSCEKDIKKLDTIQFYYKKDGAPFKDLKKCIKCRSIHGDIYPVEFDSINGQLTNREYLENYAIRISLGDVFNSEEDFNGAAIEELKKVIKNLQETLKNNIIKYSAIVDNVRALVKEYDDKIKQIEAIKNTINNNISLVLANN